MTRLLTVPLAVLAIMAAGCSTVTGPSESYSWGEKAGNSSVSLVNKGVPPSNACQDMIQAGMVWADDPVLNQTPPPKNLNMADAQKGCLDTLHKRLGY
jgi:hypothetical protein